MVGLIVDTMVFRRGGLRSAPIASQLMHKLGAAIYTRGVLACGGACRPNLQVWLDRAAAHRPQ